MVAPHRSDRAWQEAQERYVADMRDDASPTDAFVRRIQAAVDMRTIEHSYAAPETDHRESA